MFDTIVDTLKHWIFSIRGGILTVIAALSILYVGYIFFTKLIRVLWRLAKGLHKRRIAIVGEANDYSNIKAALANSKLFSDARITHIDPNSIDSVENFSLIVFVWNQSLAEGILSKKKNTAALIIYAPPGAIDKSDMENISKLANTVVVNYRGRLVNDVFVCMMTTREFS
jgi:hypothetical protein